jgi:hypothetical protein
MQDCGFYAPNDFNSLPIYPMISQLFFYHVVSFPPQGLRGHLWGILGKPLILLEIIFYSGMAYELHR